MCDLHTTEEGWGGFRTGQSEACAYARIALGGWSTVKGMELGVAFVLEGGKAHRGDGWPLS